MAVNYMETLFCKASATPIVFVFHVT